MAVCLTAAERTRHMQDGRGQILASAFRMGAARAEDAQGTPTRSHISPSMLAYEDKTFQVVLSSLASGA